MKNDESLLDSVVYDSVIESLIVQQVLCDENGE